MKKLNRAAYRAAAVAYGIRGAIGALTAACFGYCGALRDNERPLHETIFAATIGFLAGLIFWRLRWMRERGGVYYYFSWGLSAAGATAMVLLPTTFKTGDWLFFGVAVGVGMIAGCGLGAYVVMIFKEYDRK